MELGGLVLRDDLVKATDLAALTRDETFDLAFKQILVLFVNLGMSGAQVHNGVIVGLDGVNGSSYSNSNSAAASLKDPQFAVAKLVSVSMSCSSSK